MKCPICGAEISDDVKFCPNCGAKMGPDNSENPNLNAMGMPATSSNNPYDSPIVTGAGSEGLAVPRGTPEFNKRMNKIIVSGLIGTLLSVFALVGGILIRFVDLGGTEIALGIPFMFLGVVGGIVGTFAISLNEGKKLFGDAKPKGFKENCPGIFLGLTLSFIAVGLAFIGLMITAI